MVILGILILLVFAVIVIATIARGGDPTQIDLDWFVIRSNVTGVFLAGGVTLLLGVVGLLVLLSGLRRSRRRRAEVRDLRDRAAASTAAAESGRNVETKQSDKSGAASATSGAMPGRRKPTDNDESFDSAPHEP